MAKLLERPLDGELGVVLRDGMVLCQYEDDQIPPSSCVHSSRDVCVLQGVEQALPHHRPEDQHIGSSFQADGASLSSRSVFGLQWLPLTTCAIAGEHHCIHSGMPEARAAGL